MTSHVEAEVGCLLIGEYVDEAECPTDLALHRGEVERPHVVAEFIDVWVSDDGMRPFTVLLKDGRVVVVRGHGLKHAPHPEPGQDVYSIVMRTSEDEVVVALFKSADVAGIFHGNVHADRKIA